MNLFTIAWKSIRQRLLASSLTALSIALGVALMITVLVINGVVSRMFNQTATGYDLIIGPPKGSPLQLVLSTIFFVDRPIGTLPYKEYIRFRDNKAVEYAVPYALGDTTADGRYRIVGTLPRYFDHEYIPGKMLQFAQGGKLKNSFDSVIGARVARDYGWKPGHEFPVAHGGNKDDIHDEKFTVVGILKPTGTPIDRAVFIHFNGFFEIPGHLKPLSEAEAKEKAFGIQDLPEPNPNVPQDEVEADKKVDIRQKEVSAILVRTKALTYTIMIKSAVNNDSVAQAANPMEQINRLMSSFVGNVRIALVVMTAMIILVSGVGIFVSIYNSMSDRRREIAIMRALGASRTTVFSIIIAESVLLCMGGGLFGILLGHGLVFVAVPFVEERSDLYINPWSFEPQELFLIPALIVMAVVVGLIPALTAYRADVARNLQE
jgi:putative ABC transport system permease protein